MKLSTELLEKLSKQYGNAYYLLDSEQFEKNYVDLSKNFFDIYPHFNIAYSYKTNYIPKLCKIVNVYGGYAEVVSDMEMELALRIGVIPKKIIWNGPIKNFEKVEQLLLMGGIINIDSLKELEEINVIAEKHPEHKINIGIRCNFDVGDGVVSRFGLDINTEDFYKVIQFIKSKTNVHLINLQCHFARRNIEFWLARVKGMLEITDKVSEIIGYIPDRIDLGGGIFGNMEETLKKQFQIPIPKYADYAKEAATLFKKHFTESKPEMLIEPGSALAGDSMKFVGRIESIKKVRNKYFATVLGSQKNISMIGINPPIKVYGAGVDHMDYADIDLVGYTCIESDVLFHGYKGKLAVGDFVVFSNCGSYSVVMKPPFIMPNFPILDICKENVEVIKRGETFDDLFHTFSF